VGIPTALAGLLLILWGWSFHDPAPDQDNCAFGPVSKAEYRYLLAEAKAQNWTVWPGLSNGLTSPTDHGALGRPRRREKQHIDPGPDHEQRRGARNCIHADDYPENDPVEYGAHS
jgi:hypothetical protein